MWDYGWPHVQHADFMDTSPTRRDWARITILILFKEVSHIPDGQLRLELYRLAHALGILDPYLLRIQSTT